MPSDKISPRVQEALALTKKFTQSCTPDESGNSLQETFIAIVNQMTPDEQEEYTVRSCAEEYFDGDIQALMSDDYFYGAETISELATRALSFLERVKDSAKTIDNPSVQPKTIDGRPINFNLQIWHPTGPAH